MSSLSPVAASVTLGSGNYIGATRSQSIFANVCIVDAELGGRGALGAWLEPTCVARSREGYYVSVCCHRVIRIWRVQAAGLTVKTRPTSVPSTSITTFQFSTP
jgi:hypothetical protein